MRFIINPGHGGSDPGACGYGLQEKDVNLAVALALGPMLEARGIEVEYTRTTDVYMSLEQRSNFIVARKPDAALDLHHNGAASSTAHGIETYRSAFNSDSRRLAEYVHPYLIDILGMYDREIRIRLYPNRSDWDYYHMIREPQRRAGIPVIITEAGFMTNAGDTAKMKQAGYAALEAEALARGICAFFGVPWEVNLTSIIGKPQATCAQAQAWAKARGAHQRFIDVAPLYWKYGLMFGIRPEVLYVQSAKETAFGKFTGAVTPDHHNWAGIKTAGATGDKPEDHQVFASDDDGVRGHFNHMGIYCNADPIGEVHPRFHSTTAFAKSVGWYHKVFFVEELGGKWAPSPDYGRSIVRDYLNPLLSTPAPPEEPGELEELREKNAELQAEMLRLKGIIETAQDTLDKA